MSRFALGGDRALSKEVKQLAIDLRSAAEKGNVEAAKQAIWSGADVNQIDREGKTPLIHATRNGKLDLVRLLIQAKASVYIASWDGWTPLHYATWREKFAVARELIQADADVEVEGVDGRTAASLARSEAMQIVIKASVGERKLKDAADKQVGSEQSKLEVERRAVECERGLRGDAEKRALALKQQNIQAFSETAAAKEATAEATAALRDLQEMHAEQQHQISVLQQSWKEPMQVVERYKAQVAERDADLIEAAVEQEGMLQERERERESEERKLEQQAVNLTAKWDAERTKVENFRKQLKREQRINAAQLAELEVERENARVATAREAEQRRMHKAAVDAAAELRAEREDEQRSLGKERATLQEKQKRAGAERKRLKAEQAARKLAEKSAQEAMGKLQASRNAAQQNEKLLSRIEQKLELDQSCADEADGRLETLLLQCEQERQEHHRTAEQLHSVRRELQLQTSRTQQQQAELSRERAAAKVLQVGHDAAKRDCEKAQYQLEQAVQNASSQANGALQPRLHNILDRFEDERNSTQIKQGELLAARRQITSLQADLESTRQLLQQSQHDRTSGSQRQLNWESERSENARQIRQLRFEVQQQEENGERLRSESEQMKEIHHQECEQHSADNRMHEAQRTRIEGTIRQLEGSMMADQGRAARDADVHKQLQQERQARMRLESSLAASEHKLQEAQHRCEAANEAATMQEQRSSELARVIQKERAQQGDEFEARQKARHQAANQLHHLQEESEAWEQAEARVRQLLDGLAT